ncbi:uncharacterized protein I303_102533 [Kwoniella dejecticola CBS 10117]|uniref:FCP1 homology domain-containing protein n=1 Tax=Kwoniella dejecticola CBS 10117 TaxID=1296121 RepID=A0A1A6A905_9TREE|nr:uncharacterized protein I303_02547 [Kwoniella dejecticola CBS 10117]OBR86539.1 hypothetical protein I303_02547 [Kwoniella dejecticola CBS 10117]
MLYSSNNGSSRYYSTPNYGESSTHRRWNADVAYERPNESTSTSRHEDRPYGDYNYRSYREREARGPSREGWKRNGGDSRDLEDRADRVSRRSNGHNGGGEYERARTYGDRPNVYNDHDYYRPDPRHDEHQVYPPQNAPGVYPSNEARGSCVPSNQREWYKPAIPPASLPPFPPSGPPKSFGHLPPRPVSPPPNFGVNSHDQYRDYSTYSTRTSQNHHARTPFSRDRTVTPPPITLPPAEYLDLLKPTDPFTSDTVVPKLLVLDLNGALVFRNRNADGKKSHPRPYLGCFLEYLFLPTPKTKAGEARGWEVFVWSSAQPHNVRGMVEGAFEPRFIEGVWDQETRRGEAAREEGEGRLLGVWARDRMNLSSSDYSRKVQTTKDLRKLLGHLNNPSEPDQRPHTIQYDEKTIMLLDDSPLKAIYQPFNQLVIPEYGKEEHQSSKMAAGAITNGSNGEEDQDKRMDQTLLAVIGILDGLRNVNNVPAWIKLGGLTETIEIHENYRDLPVELEDLPSHDKFDHWFNNQEIFDSWVKKGKAALKQRGIEVRHGIIPDTQSRASSRLSSPLRKGHSPVRLYSKSKRGYHTNTKIDEDEVSSPPPASSFHSGPLKALDVVDYLEHLISEFSNSDPGPKLTVEQKDALLNAKDVLTDLYIQGIDQEIASTPRKDKIQVNQVEHDQQIRQSKKNGNADLATGNDNSLSFPNENNSHGDNEEPHGPSSDRQRHRPRIRSKTDTKAERMSEKKAEFERAFLEARKADPGLSKRAYKKIFAKQRNVQDREGAARIPQNQDDVVPNPEEIVISDAGEDEGDPSDLFGSDEQSDRDDRDDHDDDFEEITEEAFLRAGEPGEKSTEPTEIFKVAENEGKEADLAGSSVGLQRDSSSKRIRSDSWDGDRL